MGKSTSVFSTTSRNDHRMRVALVVPHIFMHRDILPRVIFSPGQLALSLADGLVESGVEVTLFTPGPVATTAHNVTADLAPFERELSLRGDSYTDLLRKHPLTFVSLARQVQSEIIAEAFGRANHGAFDIVHIYTNEEDIALPFAALCTKPVVFTHHDPFNFLVKYRSVMPSYHHLNWISFSQAQRRGMPPHTNWVGNVYHGMSEAALRPLEQPADDYFAYLGRIIEPKGVHLAIAAVRAYNTTTEHPMKLKIAGKHYASASKDTYWRERIEPELGDDVEYVGFIDTPEAKRDFLGNARALIVPSLFDEPFGMVTIEAFACGTPVVALDSGALPEVIDDGLTGYIVPGGDPPYDETRLGNAIADRLHHIAATMRQDCRRVCEERFTTRTMTDGYIAIYRAVIQSPDQS